MIHETAKVDLGAEIGTGVEIGPYCIVGPNVKIGDETQLMSHVVIDGHTEIGERNVFFPFSVIGAIPQDLKYKGEPTRVKIGNRNRIRENVTINLGTEAGGGVTSVGDDNLIMAYVHLGHDCHVRDHCILANNVGLAGHVEIESYANLGGMVGVSQFVKVGEHSYITGQSGLEKSVPPYCIAMGSRPCRVKGPNIVGLRRHGISSADITKLNEAIKLWTRPDIEKEQSLLEIESQYGDCKEIKHFVGFIRESRAGVVR